MKPYKIIYVLFIIHISLLFTCTLNAQGNKPEKNLAYFLENRLSLFAGLNMSKQNIHVGNFNSRFNYNLEDFQNNTFKAGYFIGFRVDNNESLKNKYDFSISLNKIVAGTNYKDINTLDPFLGTFSKFKADDNFFIINVNTHYKKQIFTDKENKRKLYVIVGPSIDIRLSNQSIDNQVYKTYRNHLFKGDIGLEFDNQTYYTLFAHYKHALHSFSQQPIITNLNTIELGTIIKASDIF